jgi:hypothetical protein
MLKRTLIALAWTLAWVLILVLLRAAIHWADVQSSHSPQEDMWSRLIQVLWLFQAATLVIPVGFVWLVATRKMPLK